MQCERLILACGGMNFKRSGRTSTVSEVVPSGRASLKRLNSREEGMFLLLRTWPTRPSNYCSYYERTQHPKPSSPNPSRRESICLCLQRRPLHHGGPHAEALPPPGAQGGKSLKHQRFQGLRVWWRCGSGLQGLGFRISGPRVP